MDRNAFKEWLVEECGIKESAAKSRVSNVARIEKEYDIDSCFANDSCQELLSLFEYTKEDQKEGNLPQNDVVISGDYYTGMQTLKMALKLYVEFLKKVEENAITKRTVTDKTNEENYANNSLAINPRYMGNLAGFKTFVAAGYRNKVNVWAKPARSRKNGECEYCHCKSELQSAHKHGMDFKDIIEDILETHFKKSFDYYEVDLERFEQLFKSAHTPIENTFYFLCENCHNSYDKSKTITDAMIEAERNGK